MLHVMADLETLGVDPDAAFISLGAVKFDPDTGAIDTDSAFYYRVEWESAIRGRSIKASTLQWWMTQSEEARAEILKQGFPLRDVLAAFKEWFPAKGIIWGNGATFDVSILSHAYNGAPPWAFRDIRDVRTIVDIHGGYPSEIKFDGVKHHALHDAIFQARYVSHIWQRLKAGLVANQRDVA